MESIKNLSDNPDGSFNPAIAAIGNNVYVIWQEDTITDRDIFFTRSIDSGNIEFSFACLEEAILVLNQITSS